MNQTLDVNERDGTLKSIGHVSYLLHLIVALRAVLPGMQASVSR
jgi:hypothetical protein